MLTVPSTSFHHSYNQAEPLHACSRPICTPPCPIPPTGVSYNHVERVYAYPQPIYTLCPPTTLTTTQNPSMPTHDPSMPHSTQSRPPAPNPTRQHLLKLLGNPQRLPVTPLYLSMPNPPHHRLLRPHGTRLCLPVTYPHPTVAQSGSQCILQLHGMCRMPTHDPF